MMCRTWFFLALVIVVEAGTRDKPCDSPIWTVDLSARYQFRPFGLVKHPRNQPPLLWRTQQGIVFISPQTLAIYQVRELEDLPPIQPRDESRGGGKFVLQIVFLDSSTGEEVQTLRLTTSSAVQSRVYATHEGRFLVVTGGLLRLYSSSFQKIVSRSLPMSATTGNENWNISVIPPGRRIAAIAHGTLRYLLDSDSLETVANPRPSDVAWWAEGNAFFPELRGSGRGVFTAEGRWMEIDPVSKAGSCTWAVFENTSQQGSGWRDCKQFQVFSLKGQVIWDVQTRDEITSFTNNGRLLAAAIYRHRTNPFDLDLEPKPLRIEVYDLQEKRARCSILVAEPVLGDSNTRFFDLSSSGSIALVQGSKLSFYPVD